MSGKHSKIAIISNGLPGKLLGTLRDLERLGLIEKVPGSFAGKGPFENQEWRSAAPPQSGKEGQ